MVSWEAWLTRVGSSERERERERDGALAFDGDEVRWLSRGGGGKYGLDAGRKKELSALSPARI